MAKRKSARSRQSATPPPTSEDFSKELDETYAGLDADQHGGFGETTGRMIAVMLDHDGETMASALARFSNQAGLKDVCHAADFTAAAIDPEQAEEADVIVLEELGIAILNGAPDQNTRMYAAALAGGAMLDHGQMIIEPETYKYAQGWEVPVEQQELEADGALDGQQSSLFPPPLFPTVDPYLLGYSSGVRAVVEGLVPQARFAMPLPEWEAATARAGAAALPIRDSATATWGLIATGVEDSPLSGQGIRVAILDTGFDAGHPDFQNRAMTRQSFVPAQVRDQFGRMRNISDHTADDRNGHGTHVAGTACGPRISRFGRRYGIAYECDIFIAKVLSVDFGSPGSAGGRDGDILAGLNWAIRNDCHVINMSLGSRANASGHSLAWENTARAALNRGILCIAATGNDSSNGPSAPRFRPPRPVGHPANCPSIVAVAAVDQNLRVASFSNAQRFTGGGEVNLAAPGVRVISAYPRHRGNLTSMPGTSMAAPHVAGIAALVAQETGLRGLPLYREVRRRAKPLSDPRTDIGNGLAHV